MGKVKDLFSKLNFQTDDQESSEGSKRRFKEIGDTGVDKVGDIITEEYNRDLRGRDGVKKFDEMRKSDATVRAAVQAVTLPIRAANWFVEPADNDEANEEVAEFVERALKEDMSITWNDFLRQALLMLPLGVMLFEKVYKRDGDQIKLKKLAPRLPKSVYKWSTQEDNTGVTWMLNDGKHVSIPIEKLAIFTNEMEGDNWWGTSILRAAYKHWHIKNTYYKIDAIAFERQGLGVPYAKMPEGADEEDENDAIEILKNIRANENAYILEPHDYEVGFKDMGAKNTKDSKDQIEHHNRQILLSVLAQFLDLGAKSTGSRALSQNHSELFYLSLRAVANEVRDTINKYIIPQLVDLNYTVDQYPKINYSDVGSKDISDYSQAISKLAKAGMINSDENVERTIREILDLPEAMDEEGDNADVDQDSDVEASENKKKRQMDFQEEYNGYRKLTFAEKKVHLKSIAEKMDEFEEDFIENGEELLKKSTEDFLQQMDKALEEGTTEAIENLNWKYQNEYEKEVASRIKEMMNFGKTNGAREMDVEAPPTPRKVTQNLNLQAEMIAEDHKTKITTEAKKAAFEGRSKDKSKFETMANVEEAVDNKVTEVLGTTAPIVSGIALNQGRRVVQEDNMNMIYALQRSEILDTRTCNYCLSIDGRVFEKDDPFTKNDVFHTHCRGIWVEVLKEEQEKPNITGAPQSLRDRFDGPVNSVIQPKKPIVRKDSPAQDFLKEEGLL